MNVYHFIDHLDKAPHCVQSNLNYNCLSKLINPLLDNSDFISSTGRRPVSYCHGIMSVVRALDNSDFISSTGQRPVSYCHGIMSVVRASVNSSFKKLLFRNYLQDFYQISQECSFGGPPSYSFK